MFSLKPVGSYQHRLVFDLYPTQAIDPLAEFIEKAQLTKDEVKVASSPATSTTENKALNNTNKNEPVKIEPTKTAETKKKTGRILTIALDPGHGGEDPGAIGPNGSREKDVVLAIAKRLKNHIDNLGTMRAFLTEMATTSSLCKPALRKPAKYKPIYLYPFMQMPSLNRVRAALPCLFYQKKGRARPRHVG